MVLMTDLKPVCVCVYYSITFEFAEAYHLWCLADAWEASIKRLAVSVQCIFNTRNMIAGVFCNSHSHGKMEF